MTVPIQLQVAKSMWMHGRRIVRQHVIMQEWRRQGVRVSDRAIVALGHHSRLEIGAGSSIGAYTILELADDPNPRPGEDPVQSTLIVGRRTAINEFNNIRAAGGTVHIGDDCLIAQHVSIIASNHSIDGSALMREAHWERGRNWVEIGNDVWIAAHAIILPGVRIGNGSVIAAGSVVTQDVTEYSVVAGIPARFKRFRNRSI